MKDVLQAFDEYLIPSGLSFEATIIGGAALIVSGTISRATRDVDCREPTIPNEIKKASREFAKARKEFNLDQDWLNNGPEALARELLPGWRGRRIKLYQGKALTLWTLDRKDLLCSKLFAYVDRQEDLADCIALKPSRDELIELLPWVQDRDANEECRSTLRK